MESNKKSEAAIHNTVECLIFARTLLREFREAP